MNVNDGWHGAELHALIVFCMKLLISLMHVTCDQVSDLDSLHFIYAVLTMIPGCMQLFIEGMCVC